METVLSFTGLLHALGPILAAAQKMIVMMTILIIFKTVRTGRLKMYGVLAPGERAEIDTDIEHGVIERNVWTETGRRQTLMSKT